MAQPDPLSTPDIATSSRRLEGKIALVSGAAGGMGASHAREIVRHGGRVVIGDLAEAAGRALADELGDAARFIRLDVRDEQSWADAVRFTLAEFGGLNVLVNNAGVLRTGEIEVLSTDDWNLVLSINLTGAFFGMRACIPALRDSAPSSIINISSTAGLKGFHGSSPYVASKWGLRGLTKSAAIELAGSGIRANSVHPGNIKTNMIDGLYENFDHVPQRRAGNVEEISNLVVFLASDESSFSTGAEFVADGGEVTGIPELGS